jgi:hypothetical protein
MRWSRVRVPAGSPDNSHKTQLVTKHRPSEHDLLVPVRWCPLELERAVALRAALFDALADVSKSRLCLFFRASRTRPRGKRFAPRVFGPPNFPKALGSNRFLKIGSPEKVAYATRPRLRSWRPVCAQQHARKASAAPFSPPPGAVVEEGETSQKQA